ncbi:hypothetical protein [Amycolatopsis sp. WAC 01416]|uniref:hypothetical protein n=1 Tax=Amycolatopsis sp. WAC 01416 TaxID=2203196 RepID=UPI0013158A62|nr:hypothetical protein [Amycolatopsis sp. WAC 01416]
MAQRRPPTDEDRAQLARELRPDPAVHGFGFAYRDGEWIVWVALAPEDRSERPARIGDYRVVYEHSGPFHAE